MSDAIESGVSALIIDDHPLIRDAVRNTILSIGSGGRVDMADSFASARRLLETDTNWDFALLDLSLPDCEGFDGLTAIRELRPGLPTIVLSGQTDRETILRCIDLGAAGYIPKTSQSDTISDAIRLVASGHVYLPREALGHEPAGHIRSGQYTGLGGSVAEPAPRPRGPAGWPPAAAPNPGLRPNPTLGSGSGSGSGAAAGAAPGTAQARDVDPRSLGLTERQCDVLRLLLRGLPNKLICRQLDLAEGTVKVHVSSVLRVLGVRNRTQAVVAVSRLGLKIRSDACG